MFREWGFLLTEMIGLILLAALLGLFVGWIVWGRKTQGVTSEKYQSLRTERETLKADLDGCRARHRDKDQQIAELESDNAALRAERDTARIEAADARADSQALRLAQGLSPDDIGIPSQTSTLLPGEEELDLRPPAWRYEPEADVADDDVAEDQASDSQPTGPALRPAMLGAPRDGQPDDLKQISGIGPKLEKLCHDLGVYHFDQIALWTAAEVAWMDDNLEGFKGRVSRDNWVEQARILADGGETDFSERVRRGDVYDT